MRSELEQQRIKKMLKVKTAREKARGTIRKKALELLNGADFDAQVMRNKSSKQLNPQITDPTFWL